MSIYVHGWMLSKDPIWVINELKKKFNLKGVGKPEYFLGADMAHREPLRRCSPWEVSPI